MSRECVVLEYEPKSSGRDFFHALFCLASCTVVFLMDYVTGNTDILLLCTMLGCAALLFLMNGASIRISASWMVWLPYFCIVVLGLPFSQDMVSTIKVLMVDLLLWGSTLLYANYSHQNKALPKLLYFFSSVFMMSVIVQLIAPKFISAINSKILPSKTYQAVTRGYSSGYHSGITGQVGTVAYFCVIFSAIVVSQMLFEKKKRWFRVLLICLTILALLLTKKRAHFLGVLIVIAVLIALVKGKRAIGTLVAAGFGMALLLLGLSFIPQTNAIFVRLISGGLAGRDKIYAILLDKFSEYPFSGIGLGCTGMYVTGHTSASTAHNEYLRALCETGIYGFITFTFALFYNYWHTVKQFRQDLRHSDRIPKDKLEQMAFSIFMQTFILMYSMMGNPLSNYSQLYMYFLCVMLGSAESAANRSVGDNCGIIQNNMRLETKHAEIELYPL